MLEPGLPVVERHEGIDVVRDDLLEGGSKTRFLPFLIEGATELVFGGPACGGAPLALAVVGKRAGIPVTLFYGKRKRENWHARQLQAEANGARIVEVFGRMSNIQAKARAYAARCGARFLPLGFDTPEAEEPFVRAMVQLRRDRRPYAQVWCAAGSGMLARCLSRAFPEATIHAVLVGLKSRNSVQEWGPNVKSHQHGLRFEQECKVEVPFPCCPNYDRKAWELCLIWRKGYNLVGRGKPPRALFWNVM